jgi:L-lysine exporter family protein LysE/ArgO
MLGPALDGFVIGASLIVAIGAQNAFVLRQGLERRFVFAVCLTCALSDALLIAAGVAGLGRLVQDLPGLVGALTVAGAAFLLLYGLRAFFRAARPGAMQAGVETGRAGLGATLAACLAFTFLNPHVYLDTVLLIGGLSTRHAGVARLAYGAGAAAASFAWFFALGYGARLLAPLFARPGAWRALDIGIGAVMWVLAAMLAASLR